MKISTSLYFDRSTDQLGKVQASMSKTQEQLSTGLQVVKPSDAPDKASLVTRLETNLARQTSYQDTIKAINVRKTAEETAMTSASDVMTRIKELAVEAGNDTLNVADRQTIALEMKTLRDQMLSLANAQDANGNYLFSGGRAGQPAFSSDPMGNIQYSGDQFRMQVNVGDNRRINLNTPGSDVFIRIVRDDGNGNRSSVDFFGALDEMINAVKSTDRIKMKRGLDECDTMQNGISNGLGQIGADMEAMDFQNSNLDGSILQLKKTKSDIEDLDYTEAITRMNKDQLALEAAQSSFAKISKLSLFNYIN